MRACPHVFAFARPCVFVCDCVRLCVCVLQSLGLIKYWKGIHLIHADPKVVQEYWAKYSQARMLEVDPSCLHWQPLPTPTAGKKRA